MAAGASDSSRVRSGTGAGAGPGSSIRERERQQVFEFTKRKRWADIIISEVPDSIMLILNPHRTVLYCGPAVVELLGWQPENMVDHDFLNFVNDDDSQGFANNFQQSITARENLVTYVRLKCKTDLTHTSKMNGREAITRELLFEITGQALKEQDEFSCRLFFAVAKPYPSRNTAIMNTFLELKIENERLTQHLKERRLLLAQASSGSNPNTLSIPSGQMHGYSSSPTAYGIPVARTENGSSSNTHRMNSTFVQSTYGQMYEDNSMDDGGVKKKFRKVAGSEPQYICVTCGRTSSPEWRKGPMGPKTLCNACGLRWAKRAKKTDDTPANTSTPSPPTPKLSSNIGETQTQSSSMPAPAMTSADTLVSPHDPPAHDLLSSSPMSMPGYQHMSMGMNPPMPISTTYHSSMPSMASMHSPTSMAPSHQYPQHQQLQPQSYAPPPFPLGHEMDGQNMWGSHAHGHHQSHGRYPGY